MNRNFYPPFFSSSLIILSFIISFIFYSCKPSVSEKNKIFVTAGNITDLERPDEIIEIPLKELKSKFNSFNESSFLVKEGEKEIPSQLEDKNGDGIPDNLLFISSFGKNEVKKFAIYFNIDGSSRNKFIKRTMAVLGEKKNYILKDGYYTGGNFEDVDSSIVPANHFAHDALYRIEGPGWESNQVAYRFYLDSRNRTDIFGKKTNELIMNKVGINDLVSNSQESYTKMLPWGMDIFKVGESLGIGSIALWEADGFHTVSKTDKVKCYVSCNGPIRSDINTVYSGWQVDKNKIDLVSNISISAGSRLTHVELSTSDDKISFCTGLAKHENTKLIFSDGDSTGWIYLGLYGKQSLSGDDLGIAVFFKKSELFKISEDAKSHIVIFKTGIKNLNYYFCAAWQQEPNGIKNIGEFEKYLSITSQKLNNPIQITF